MQKQYTIELPDIVQTVKDEATALGFDLRPGGNIAGQSKAGASACLDEVGSLLRTLTTSFPVGRVGEVGTGVGIGSAWIASGLASTATLTTVELDKKLASAAYVIFSDYKNIEVIAGDWLEMMPRQAPFDLLFFDGGGPQALHPENWPMIASLLKPSGIMVIDDLTPEEDWPKSWQGKPDAKRDLAFRSGLFTATEIRSRANSAVLLLVKRRSAT